MILKNKEKLFLNNFTDIFIVFIGILIFSTAIIEIKRTSKNSELCIFLF